MCGRARNAAQVTVFHFGSVPALLAAAVREHGSLQLALRAEECRRLAELAQQLQADFHEPNTLSNLVFQGALLELMLLALRKLPEREAPCGSEIAGGDVAETRGPRRIRPGAYDRPDRARMLVVGRL